MPLPLPPGSSPERSSWRLVLLVGGLCLASAAWFALPLERYAQELIEWFRARPIEGPAAFTLFTIATAVLLVPSSLPTLAAGAIWGLLWGSVLLHVASVIADVVCFVIGRAMVRGELRESCLRSHPRLRMLDEALAREGWALVVLIRWCPIAPNNVLNYLFGMTSVSMRDYVWATAIGTIPNTLIFVYLGTLFGGAEARVSDDPRVLFVWSTLALLSTIGLTRYARNGLRGHLAHAEGGESVV